MRFYEVNKKLLKKLRKSVDKSKEVGYNKQRRQELNESEAQMTEMGV